MIGRPFMIKVVLSDILCDIGEANHVKGILSAQKNDVLIHAYCAHKY